MSYERTLLNKYSAWVTENLQQQEAALASKYDQITLESALAKLKAQRQRLIDANEDDSEVAELDGQILQEEQEQERLIEEGICFNKFKARGIMLQHLLMYMVEDKVMKRAAFFQCILTVMTYIIFALNTAITGFGLCNVASQNGNITAGV